MGCCRRLPQEFEGSWHYCTNRFIPSSLTCTNPSSSPYSTLPVFPLRSQPLHMQKSSKTFTVLGRYVAINSVVSSCRLISHYDFSPHPLSTSPAICSLAHGGTQSWSGRVWQWQFRYRRTISDRNAKKTLWCECLPMIFIRHIMVIKMLSGVPLWPQCRSLSWILNTYVDFL